MLGCQPKQLSFLFDEGIGVAWMSLLEIPNTKVTDVIPKGLQFQILCFQNIYGIMFILKQNPVDI